MMLKWWTPGSTLLLENNEWDLKNRQTKSLYFWSPIGIKRSGSTEKKYIANLSGRSNLLANEKNKFKIILLIWAVPVYLFGGQFPFELHKNSNFTENARDFAMKVLFNVLVKFPSAIVINVQIPLAQ